MSGKRMRFVMCCRTGSAYIPKPIVAAWPGRGILLQDMCIVSTLFVASAATLTVWAVLPYFDCCMSMAGELSGRVRSQP